MNFKLALGTGVAIVAAYCVLVIGIVRKTAFYDSYHLHAGIGISIVGAGYFAISAFKRRNAPPPAGEDGAATAADESAEPDNAAQAGSRIDGRYVGLISMILGVATVFILPLPPTPKTLPVRAAEPSTRSVVQPVLTNEPPPVQAPIKPVAFPALRLQGIYYKPERPSALIDGKTYFIGDWVQNAKVVAITRDLVMIEIEGQQQVYSLEK